MSHQQRAGLVAPSRSPPRTGGVLVSPGAWGLLPSPAGRQEGASCPCGSHGLSRSDCSLLLPSGPRRALVSARRLTPPCPVTRPLPHALLCSADVPAALWCSAGSTPSSPTSRRPTARCFTSAPSVPWRSSQPPAPTRTFTRSTLASATSSPSKCSLQAGALAGPAGRTRSTPSGWGKPLGEALSTGAESWVPLPFIFPSLGVGQTAPRAARSPPAKGRPPRFS